MNFNPFNQRKIKGKLLFSFGIVLVLSSILAGWGYFSITRILEIRKLKEDFMTVNEIVLKMRKSEKDFLMRETISSDFMESHESKYVKAIDDYTAQQDSIITGLLENKWSDRLEINEELGLLRNSLVGYHDSFKKIVDAYIVRGFKDFGDEGELRAAIHGIEKSGLNFNEVRMLTLRRHEKDFFMRKDLSYVDKFDKEVELFKKGLYSTVADREIREKIDVYQQKFHEIVEAEQRIGLDEKSGFLGEMRADIHEIEPLVEKLEEIIEAQTDKISFQTSLLFAGVFLVELLIGLMLAMSFSSKLTSKILEIRGAALSLAEGIIPQPLEVNSNDELGETQESVNELITSLQESVSVANLVSKGNLYSAKESAESKLKNGDLDTALKNMINKLTEIVENITGGADEINVGSKEISKSSGVVAQGATEQASSLEEISSSVEQMVSNINQNADNSSQAEVMTREAASKMQQVKDATNLTFNSVREITENIEIINEIADKTNLLAINAAVEAARAGEHGKGFAVVASEVRKLAERSQAAAEGIIDLSKNCIKEAENSGNLLEELAPDVEKSFNLVREISSSSAEQRSGAEQINVALTQLNQVTQQNASSSEELSSAANNFNNQAEQLKATVSFFKLDKKNESTHHRSQIIEQIEQLKSLLNDDDVKKEVASDNGDFDDEIEIVKSSDQTETVGPMAVKENTPSKGGPYIKLDDFDAEESDNSDEIDAELKEEPANKNGIKKSKK